jgi:hypothetical protein
MLPVSLDCLPFLIVSLVFSKYSQRVPGITFKQNKNTAQYMLDTTIHKTQDEGKQNKNTAQYMLDTTIHKTQDEGKQNKNTAQYMLDTTIHKTQSCV